MIPVTASPKTVSLQLDLPADVFAIFKDEQEDVTSFLRQQVALKQYREGKISMGKAAEVAGVPLADFLHLMGQHKLSPFRFTAQEWKEEMRPL